MAQHRSFMTLTVIAAAIGAGCATIGDAGAADHNNAQTDAALLARANKLLHESPLIDGHNDVPGQYFERVRNHLDQIDFASDLSGLTPPMHSDLPRLRRGGLGAQFWSVYIPASEEGFKPGDVKRVLEQIDLTRRLVAKYADSMELAFTADDIERIFHQGKIASLMGMEGGHSIENSLAALRMTYLAGARYMTLTHMLNTNWADSATDEPDFGGLTRFGEEVVREMNRLGMLVDLSHVSPDTMRDALDVTRAPVIFSHSSARALTDTPRNVPDDVLRLVRDNGGVVMVTFVPVYVSQPLYDWSGKRDKERSRLKDRFGDNTDGAEKALQVWEKSNPKPSPGATLSDVADHIDHIRQVAGIDHVGIGSDFDGVSSLPEGLEDVSTFPRLIAELLSRGYSDEDVKKVMGQNLLRVMRQAERVAAKLKQTEQPSDARIEELDGDGNPR